MNNNLLEKYAHLIVKTGINLQDNQTLVISAPIECAPFTRLVAEKAYQEGARDVVIQWRDELFSKIRFLNASEEVFEEFPEWQKECYRIELPSLNDNFHGRLSPDIRKYCITYN